MSDEYKNATQWKSTHLVEDSSVCSAQMPRVYSKTFVDCQAEFHFRRRSVSTHLSYNVGLDVKGLFLLLLRVTISIRREGVFL